ncbi:MAG: glycosyltransferase family 4 protein, partial [Planctomycetota bacterium]|nr:glycosyltransferase family 4 protein [Planctomycetota bacterium]
MNIGLLITRFPPDLVGGAELQIRQVAAELARRGHAVTVFTRRYNGRPFVERQDGYLIRRRRELPIPALRMLWDTIPALWNIFRQRPRPQVLLCYQMLNSGLIGVVAQSALGIPAVVSIRGQEEYRIADSLRNRLLIPAIFRRARSVVVQMPGIQNDLQEQLEKAGKAELNRSLQSRIAVVPNGVTVACSQRSRGTKVVYIGRLVADKGVADLLQALKELPNLDALIVGDGPDRQRLESMAQGSRVTFVGEVPPEEVVQYLQQARMLVLPSLREGLANVILEAMANGVPVVTTRVEGTADLVRHN